MTTYDLSYQRDLIDFTIAEISYTQRQRHQIPCGYMGNNLFLKSFTDLFDEGEQKYLQDMYTEHHELYKYECEMTEKLADLRTQYTDIESAMYTQLAVADARARGIIPAEDKTAIYIGDSFDSYDEDEAFGEIYDFA
jgi:hypothetical protein